MWAVSDDVAMGSALLTLSNYEITSLVLGRYDSILCFLTACEQSFRGLVWCRRNSQSMVSSFGGEDVSRSEKRWRESEWESETSDSDRGVLEDGPRMQL